MQDKLNTTHIKFKHHTSLAICTQLCGTFINICGYWKLLDHKVYKQYTQTNTWNVCNNCLKLHFKPDMIYQCPFSHIIYVFLFIYNNNEASCEFIMPGNSCVSWWKCENMLYKWDIWWNVTHNQTCVHAIFKQNL